MDSIHIKGLRLFAFHGVNPEEKKNGQYFFLDIILYVNIDKACTSDCLSDTVNYSSAVKAAARVFQRQSFDLIERAAEEVADALLREFPSVCSVTVFLKKPNAPVAAEFDYVGVEIHRDRKDVR